MIATDCPTLPLAQAFPPPAVGYADLRRPIDDFAGPSRPWPAGAVRRGRRGQVVRQEDGGVGEHGGGVGGGGRFLTTQWSRVLAAGDSLHPESSQALSDLCERYWYPVYVFARRRVADADAAEDLVQGFFSHLLERKTLRSADPLRGRFRSFLLGAFKFYLADERERAGARKRGGGAVVASLDLDDAESRYRLEARADDNPDRLFERRWAMEVLAHAHRRLGEEAAASANPERARRLAGFLTDAGGARYREVAEELEMTEAAVKVAVHRLRRRFGTLLREEVARTVEDPAKVDEELRFLFAALE
jgi:RNA polymerase sigma factor (sigma-70 family)